MLDVDDQGDLCAGFFSGRHPTKPDLFLTPSHGVYWDEATPDDLCVYDGPTRLVGRAPPNFPSAAVPAAVYAARPDVNAIVHAHPEAVMALCALDVGVLPISEPSFLFYDRVARLDCDFFFGDAYVRKIVDALRDPTIFCVLFSNHSYLMCASTVQECWLRCYMLHQAAKIQNAVFAANGGRAPDVPGRDACLYHRRSYGGFDGCPPYDGKLEWAGARRKLDRTAPHWKGDEGAALARAFDASVSSTQGPTESAC